MNKMICYAYLEGKAAYTNVSCAFFFFLGTFWINVDMLCASLIQSAHDSVCIVMNSQNADNNPRCGWWRAR